MPQVQLRSLSQEGCCEGVEKTALLHHKMTIHHYPLRVIPYQHKTVTTIQESHLPVQNPENRQKSKKRNMKAHNKSSTKC